ncbi:MAG: [FeFe] hydrogenase H-cluster maturation GTPase HydF [Lentisphaerae bacterium]|nr:[FeFe] hydrogenase H-cluster maturation GTPase HydF [Lentisphaerota bacterium]
MKNNISMDTTPKSLRLQLAICGRINAGKSTLLNLISGQSAAITSPERGTTTDVVEKVMELRPLGPVVLLDTAGVDDDSPLGSQRTAGTRRAIERADAVILAITPGLWDNCELSVIALADERKIPVIPVVNFHHDMPDEKFLALIKEQCGTAPVTVCAANLDQRSSFLDKLTPVLMEKLPESLTTPPFLNDLIPENSLVVLMTPIDSQAPKGRLIMPEVTAIRDILDGHAVAVVAREDAFPEIYHKLNAKPALAVCDSQVVDKMIATTPADIPQTTFSILMSRAKGDIVEFASGCAAINFLKPGNKVLIAEACTHHAGENDIGKVQIPGLLQKKFPGIKIDFASGADYPEDLQNYQLLIHCGGCMLNRRAMLNRLRAARNAGVPVCNYGMCIASCKGVIEKVLSPFPEALQMYRNELDRMSKMM